MPVTYVKAKVTKPSHMFAARFMVSPCLFPGLVFVPLPISEILRSAFGEATKKQLCSINLINLNRFLIFAQSRKSGKATLTVSGGIQYVFKKISSNWLKVWS